MGWYNSNWQFRKKITIDNTKVNADLTDFPVYVDLSDLGSDFFSNVKADGGDIRITKADGTTEVPREIVSISNELEATSGSWSSGADTVETVPANTDGEIFFTINYDKNIGANYFMGGFSEEADAPATGYNGIDFAIYGSPNASLQVFENGTQVHNTGSALAVGDIVSVNRNGSTGAITYKLNGTTFYTSTTSTTAELKGDITVNNSNDYISNIRMYDGTKTFFPSFDNLVNMINSHIGEAHFKADGTLSSSTDTDFYIYYGNASATEPAVTATYGRNNVWDTNYLGVWHLEETPSVSAYDVVDSTGNNFDMQAAGTTPTSASGQLGKGVQFAGGRLYSNATWQANQPITMEAWIYLTSTGNQTVFGNGADSLANRRNLLMFGGTKIQHTEVGGDVRQNGSIAINNWHYVCTTKDAVGGAGSVSLYANGNFEASTLLNPSYPPSTTTGATNNIFLGSNVSGTETLSGIIDEARFSTTERTSDWISTQYNNQNSASTFYSAGAQETNQINIVSISPAHESTGNAVDTNLVITYDDNVTAGTGSLTVTQRDGLIIGDGFAGKIGEMILTNENLSQDTIEKVEGYLAWKWFGINNPLPDSHPYKLRRPVI